MHQIIQLSNVAVHADGSCPDGEFVLDLNIMSFLLSLLTQLLALSLPLPFTSLASLWESSEMLLLLLKCTLVPS